MQEFSIASNATFSDGPSLRRIIPHWMRVFADHLVEILVVVDVQPLEQRIAELQSGHTNRDLFTLVKQELTALDSRVRFVCLDNLDKAAAQKTWFGKARPVRCQAGTPVLAFVAGIEAARSDYVLHCDSDMLFYENGWLGKEAFRLLESAAHIYEPPPSKHCLCNGIASSRTFMVRKSNLLSRLPLRDLHLDILRRLHRKLHGRPTWVALEQMVQRNAAKGRIVHRVGVNSTLGFSLHGVKRDWTSAPWFEHIIHSMECGDIPPGQESSPDLQPDAWGFPV